MVSKTILVTGASGFIGKAVCAHLSNSNKVVGLVREIKNSPGPNDQLVKGDVTDNQRLQAIIEKYLPDVIIHCAGIAHQNIFKPLRRSVYNDVNCDATKEIAKIAAQINPRIHFIFLSSVSVYGETAADICLDEYSPPCPSSFYAESKLNAEIALRNLSKTGILKKIDVLRLAPVYDKSWCLNLEKRVMGLKKLCYLRFGAGNQRMSILARRNLIEFIQFRIEKTFDRDFEIFNVCDEKSCSFNDIIHSFQNSNSQPNRVVLKVPLFVVRFTASIIGRFFKRKAVWINSFYNKLAYNLVFSNKRMLETGFRPRHSLSSVFNSANEE